MTNKMPTTLKVWECEPHKYECDERDHVAGEEYTLVHDNPDYHVIKKVDVDADALEHSLSALQNAMAQKYPLTADFGRFKGDIQVVMEAVEEVAAEKRYLTEKEQKTMHDALMSSVKVVNKPDPDTVTIPRKVLELYAHGHWQEGGGVYDEETHEIDFGCKARQALDVLNYKEGE